MNSLESYGGKELIGLLLVIGLGAGLRPQPRVSEQGWPDGRRYFESAALREESSSEAAPNLEIAIHEVGANRLITL